MIDAADLLALPPGLLGRRELQPLRYAVLEQDRRLSTLSDGERGFARAAYVNTRARSAQLAELLRELLDAAAAVDVALLPLKGALLAFAAYPDPGMRPMGDLDLAVRPGDAARLVAHLAGRGFRQRGLGQRRFDLAHTHTINLERPATSRVELHVRLVHELGADGDVAPLFARAIELPLLGRRVLAPSWSDHLAYVALHAATHAFADSPLWLFDALLLAPRVDAAAVAGHASRARAVAAVHFACAIARRYCPGFTLATPAPRARGLRARLIDRALGDDPLARRPGFVASHLVRLALTDRAIDMARSLGSKVALRATERLVERVAAPPWR